MKFVGMLLLLSVKFSFAQVTTTKSFTINGTLTDLENGSVVTIVHPSSQSVLATDTAKNKKFTLKGNAGFVGLGRINFTKDKMQKGMDLFFGNENIKITGALKTIETALVAGAPSQNVFKSFKKIFEPDFKALNKINTELNGVTDQVVKQKAATNFENKVKEIDTKLTAFVQKNSKSPVTSFALFVTKDLFAANPYSTKEKMDMLSGSAVESIYYETLNKDIESKLFGSIGSNAVDFKQKDTAGKEVTLSSFKGKYVLLDFWASWCGPCRMENPNVVTAFNKFKSKNFTIIGVSLDRPGKEEDWKRAIAEDNLTWTNVSDLKFWQNEVAQLYKVGSIPQNYLIDPNGKIVGKNLRGPALEEKLCELLGCN